MFFNSSKVNRSTISHSAIGQSSISQSDTNKSVINHCCILLIFIIFLTACGSGSDTAINKTSETVSESETTEAANTGESNTSESEANNNATPQIETVIVKDGTVVAKSALISLGENLFNDTNLSSPPGQSCASCHSPTTGFDDPDSSNPTSIGADNTSFGTRNSPTASYAAHIPPPQAILRTPPNGGPQIAVRIGGLFLDGRAESLEEQAKGPFLNPAEMAMASKSDVINAVKLSVYAADFEALFGSGILEEPETAYNYIADAIAAFERTARFSPFNSKFDLVQSGDASFTAEEARGERLFNGKAQCVTCHSANTDNGEPQLFSHFEYRNIGVPSNPLLPALMADPEFIDNGLGEVSTNTRDNGRFRTPTLRNIALTAPYMHNGVFNTLTEVIDFYNTRDSGFAMPAEANENIDQGGRIGELALTSGETEDLVAFLLTLSDQSISTN